ncbi:hypothetical protein DRQ25_00235 [Candidatus Fermentibacteria bacterium]|nr:MAG: hypothetical protein DRQ25_00235 [Candidatus Fermentibacteria bacterium]
MRIWTILFFWLTVVLLSLTVAYYAGERDTQDIIVTYEIQAPDALEISINKSLFDKLEGEYTHRDVEYLYCLRGQISNREIMIADIVEEKDVFSCPYAVFMYETPCNYSDCVGTLHPHHSGNCSPSQEDILFWRSMCDEEDMPFHMIQCGAEKFRGYLCVNNGI